MEKINSATNNNIVTIIHKGQMFTVRVNGDTQDEKYKKK